jgi:hypothetical protein
MVPTKHVVGAVRFLLVCSASAFVFLVQPNVAVAQTTTLDIKANCLATAGPVTGATGAIAALETLRNEITENDVLDLDDVLKDIDSAIGSLRDNVLGESSRLAQVCAHLKLVAANSSSERVITGDDCAGQDDLTCDGEVLFENYQDAVEALREGAIPNIRSGARLDQVRTIIRQVFTAVEDLVDLVIDEAGNRVSPGSDSPAIVDALQNQQIADGQAATCFDGKVLRACGDAVGSFFDAWLNAIIEIIE